MGSNNSIATASSVVAMLALGIALLPSATAAAKPDSIRKFDAGPGWLIYDEAVDVALHVLNPSKPKCHEIGEIILLFETRDQLRDDNLIRQAAFTGMNHYVELCRSLGVKPSRQQTLVGVLAKEAQPDKRGRVIGDGRLVEAVVSSLTGKSEVRIRNKVGADSNPSDATPITAAAKEATAESNAPAIGEHRKKYDAMLAASSTNATAPGVIGGLAGGDRAKLIGVWSASPKDCAKERVILFENKGVGIVEWWRAPNDHIGLLPWRTGNWALRGNTLIASFDHRTKYDQLRRKLLEGAIDETVRFSLEDVSRTALRLSTISGGFSPEALFLGGADKLFVRCPS